MSTGVPFTSTGPSFDQAALRQAFACFPSGVTAFCGMRAGRPEGMAASSFTSVSLEPPLVLWSLSRKAGSMPAFERGSHYAIHILAADQRALAERFATRSVDRFADLPFTEGVGGAPVFEGAAAVFECFNRSRYEEGDHVIFVGEVERCTRRAGASPLIFHGGRYYAELPL